MASGSVFFAAKSSWTAERNKLFENALAVFGEGVPDRWARIAAAAGASEEEVRRMYEILEIDIWLIESGQVAIPNYEDYEESSKYLNKSFGEQEQRLKKLKLGVEKVTQ